MAASATPMTRIAPTSAPRREALVHAEPTRCRAHHRRLRAGHSNADDRHPIVLPTTMPSNTFTPCRRHPSTAVSAITGTAAQGQTLTASEGAWTNSPTLFSYVWQDCLSTTCSASPTSTNSTTYAVTAADVAGGYAIRVEVDRVQCRRIRHSRLIDDRRGRRDCPLTLRSHDHRHGGRRDIDRTCTALGRTVPRPYTYQWLSCTASSATTCTAISRRDGPDVRRSARPATDTATRSGDRVEHQRDRTARRRDRHGHRTRPHRRTPRFRRSPARPEGQIADG